jgi:DNA-binding PadR family transcriptional regulator
MATKELMAASSRPLVLSILSQGESYGYEIIQHVKEISGGQLTWTEGMLYPVLHRLEREGLIKSRWVVADTGRKRKYYRVVAAGKKQLKAERQQWEVVDSMLRDLWGGLSKCSI